MTTARPKLWILTIMFTTPGAMVKLVYDEEMAAKSIKNQLDEALDLNVQAGNDGDVRDSIQKVRDSYGANLSIVMGDVMAINLSDLEAEFQGGIEFGLRQEQANQQAMARAAAQPSLVTPFQRTPPRN